MVEKRNYIVRLPTVEKPRVKSYYSFQDKIYSESAFSGNQAIGYILKQKLGKKNVGRMMNQIKAESGNPGEDISVFTADVGELEKNLMKESAEINTRVSNISLSRAVAEKIGGIAESYKKAIGDYLIDNPAPMR